MAGIKDSQHYDAIRINSNDTALCIIAPDTACGNVDRLRELYDKAYGKWPAHINLVYPFVAPENLPRAQEQLKTYFDEHLDTSKSRTTILSDAGIFKHRNNSTVFLQESQSQSDSSLASLRSMALQALGQKPAPSNLHLTIGQTENNTLFSQQFLLSKARLLPKLQFRIGALAILVRDRSGPDDCMKLWGVIDVARPEEAWRPSTPEHWIGQFPTVATDLHVGDNEGGEAVVKNISTANRNLQSGPIYCFDPHQNAWSVCENTSKNGTDASNLKISSYNVLIDSEYPPTHERDPFLISTILSESAAADVLVLQEVSDDFLSCILSNPDIQERYQYVSHGPPSQSDIGPLPNLRNVVILSRWCFSWKFVSFQQKYKGALVAKFGGLISNETCSQQGLVVAGVHLTAGLTDSSVAAKNQQLQALRDYLVDQHDADAWVIAGDFNIPTSTYTIDTALKDGSISKETVATLSSIETEFSDAGLIDTWAVARVEATDEVVSSTYDELFDGEEGATFDPRNNILAAATSETSIGRPQRYDRILARFQDNFRVSRCNHFGLPSEVDGSQVVPSDHAGIRSTLEFLKPSTATEGQSLEQENRMKIALKRAGPCLSQSAELDSVLASGGMFPSEEEVQQRKDALEILKRVVYGTSSDDVTSTSDVPMIIVPVGSYALGVWTSGSDIDCLCIGTISSKTFFKLARQRLVKAHDQGVRVLRKVEANTGTMLELSVLGVAMDLQYCPAARVVERWSEFAGLPASDPIFNLSILSLRKLKPYRDLLYIQRTLPSLSAFRLAYRCIKLWAVRRGIYSAKFGYLGGVHITLMLSWAAKCLAHDSGSITAPDLVSSFFHHFAHFNWTNDMMYDAFFHKQKPRYHRSAREPMVVLGFHAPNSNIAHTSTLPGLHTLVSEMKAADEALSDPSMTWKKFFGSTDNSPQAALSPISGASDFLSAHSSYVKIDIQFWGRTLAKGKSLVGWVESRCLSLVVDIYKMLPDLAVRIWPARFTDSDTIEGGDYHGCYLIGLSRPSNEHALNTQEDKASAKQALDKILDRFLTQLKTDERNYDSSVCWIDISLAKANDVKSLRLDDREWGDYVAELDPDSDDEEEIEELSDDVEEPLKRAIPQRPKPTATPLSSSKLRPASDVLHRLRWDPNLDPAEYIIGYEDRFLGPRETGLEKWKTEQTDDEFIPQHRILYFKKKGGESGDGEVVWERATRIDKIFGSGAGAGGTTC
ncbi:polynucleotide adenylyltransferase [Parastagonospora nodorum]|nr:polynucleotide adenylyltransferase [Parastagonospora nodorum]KAH5002478.1 polynucleotide adenylyltransferase [Parastagonospora nodorum]KAH5561444.1 polynucleotide adenylyltransferase [Parastagonospora nodorum]KAH6340834.1 polynucleotide adenylyltransferase [Parastagonospora nodorum]KAH6344277.1 polynucleotide adenylyltransferase [Parastagonospora nodorum]